MGRKPSSWRMSRMLVEGSTTTMTPTQRGNLHQGQHSIFPKRGRLLFPKMAFPTSSATSPLLTDKSINDKTNKNGTLETQMWLVEADALV
jgi:hypothetical protein